MLPDKMRFAEAFRNFDQKKPIDADHEFYINCDDIRGAEGERVVEKLAIRLQTTHLAGDSYAHLLFSGHVGSGKSTELLSTKNLLETEDYNFTVLYLNADEKLDRNNIHPTDLLVVIAGLLYESPEVDLPDLLMKNVQQWFAEVVYETTEEKEFRLKVEAGLGLGASIPLLTKLFTKLNATIARGGSEKTAYRRKLRKNISSLLWTVNQMLQAAENSARARGKDGLILIIDNLEKMYPIALDEENDEPADNFLYIKNGHILSGLDCHLICTVPISLINSPLGTRLKDNFDEHYILPILKIKQTRSDEGWETGIDRMIAIATKRLDGLDLFGDPDLLRELVVISGGNLKNFIRLMRSVLVASQFEKTFPINQAIIDRVIQNEARDFDDAIYDDRFARLAQIARTKTVEKIADSPDWDMLQNGWVLAYANAEEWYDVAPIIRRLPRFEKLWNSPPAS